MTELDAWRPDEAHLAELLALYRLEREIGACTEPALGEVAPLAGPPSRLSILSGSFNPLTHGHVALADAARRQGHDGVLMLLPLRAIDKETVTRAATVDRLLVLTRWAQRRGATAVAVANRGLYVDQAELIRHSYPDAALIFVVGFDKIVQILDPRYYDDREAALARLFALATFLVAPRGTHGQEHLEELMSLPRNRPFAGAVSPLAVEPGVGAISSSEVREAARLGRPWEHLVPPETAAFMRACEPYTSVTSAAEGDALDRYALRLALLGAVAEGTVEKAGAAKLYERACQDNAEGAKLRSWLTQIQSSPQAT